MIFSRVLASVWARWRLAICSPAALQRWDFSGLPHFTPKAKRVIFLFQSGGPSHLDLFDYKPGLKEFFDKDLPDSVRQGQRITGMVSGQARLPVQPTRYKFQQCGESGRWISELLPHTQKISDELCVIRSMNTEAINHDPAITFMQSGSQLPGRPSLAHGWTTASAARMRICRRSWS